MSHHLSKNRLPFTATILFANAVGRQLIVATLFDLIQIRAQQDLDQMPGPIAFPCPQSRRQRHPHRRCSIEHIGRLVAKIAMTAGRRLFAKIAEQGFATAFKRLAQPQKRIETRVISHTTFRRRKTLINLLTPVTNVIGSKERECLSGCSVTTCATDLLVVRLNRFR